MGNRALLVAGILLLTQCSGIERRGSDDLDATPRSDSGLSERDSDIEDDLGDEDSDLSGAECQPGWICIPGASRYCDTPVYCHWGIQHCRDDGSDWTPCIETTDVPEICVNSSNRYTPGAEVCCAAQGFCCHDYWDLDFDGITSDSYGECDDIACD